MDDYGLSAALSGLNNAIQGFGSAVGKGWDEDEYDYIQKKNLENAMYNYQLQTMYGTSMANLQNKLATQQAYDIEYNKYAAARRGLADNGLNSALAGGATSASGNVQVPTLGSSPSAGSPSQNKLQKRALVASQFQSAFDNFVRGQQISKTDEEIKGIQIQNDKEAIHKKLYERELLAKIFGSEKANQLLGLEIEGKDIENSMNDIRLQYTYQNEMYKVAQQIQDINLTKATENLSRSQSSMFRRMGEKFVAEVKQIKELTPQLKAYYKAFADKAIEDSNLTKEQKEQLSTQFNAVQSSAQLQYYMNGLVMSLPESVLKFGAMMNQIGGSTIGAAAHMLRR